MSVNRQIGKCSLLLSSYTMLQDIWTTGRAAVVNSWSQMIDAIDNDTIEGVKDLFCRLWWKHDSISRNIFQSNPAWSEIISALFFLVWILSPISFREQGVSLLRQYSQSRTLILSLWWNPSVQEVDFLVIHCGVEAELYRSMNRSLL